MGNHQRLLVWWETIVYIKNIHTYRQVQKSKSNPFYAMLWFYRNTTDGTDIKETSCMQRHYLISFSIVEAMKKSLRYTHRQHLCSPVRRLLDCNYLIG